MKAYILTIIGSTLLSAYASNLAPESWRKYVRIITGLVLIICILSPIKSLVSTDLFEDFDITEFGEVEGKTQEEIVVSELGKRIEDDIAARMKKEFDLNVSAEVTISVNEAGGIEGVKEIRTSGDALTNAAKSRLCEVYGVTEVKNE